MAADVVQVQGAADLGRTLARAARDLGDMTTAHRQVVDQTMAAARAGAPRRTGRLAASGTTSAGARQGLVAFGVPYAGVIHYGWRARNIVGRPFAWNAVERTEQSRDAAYLAAIDRVLAQVKGV